MRSLWRSWLLLVILALGGAIAASIPGAAQTGGEGDDVIPSLPTPPLFPGEVLVRTANGCGQILGAGVMGNVSESDIHTAQERVYTGSCERGLLQGEQEYSIPIDGMNPLRMIDEFQFGRLVSERIADASTYLTRYFLFGSVAQMGDSATIAAGKLPANSRVRWDIVRPGREIRFEVAMTGCFIYSDVFHECDLQRADAKKFLVAGLYLVDNHFPTQKGDLIVGKPCANRARLESCLTGTVVARLKSWLPDLQAATREADAWRGRIAALNTSYPAAYDAALAARQSALAAKAERDRIAKEQQAKADRDRIAAEQASAAARAKQAAQEEAEFEASLNRLGPGQLFAKADELQAAGEIDKARRMLRALIARFPDSPLAATAAQQLSGTGWSAPAPRATPGGGAGGVGATGTIDCEGIMLRYMQKISPTANSATVGQIDNSHRPSYTIWLQRKIREASRAVGCPAGFMARIDASIPRLQQACRDATPADNCDGGIDYRPAGWSAREADALADAQAEARPARLGLPAEPTPAALMCRQKLREDDVLASRENVSAPPNAIGGGTLLVNQYAMYLYQRRVGVLDGYCRGQPEYEQRAAAQHDFELAKENCARVAVGNVCPGAVQPPLK